MKCKCLTTCWAFEPEMFPIRYLSVLLLLNLTAATFNFLKRSKKNRSSARVLLESDKGVVFRRARPNARASPPRHTPLQLVSSFCCFPTTVYMQPGSLFISSASLYVRYPLALFISWASAFPPHFPRSPFVRWRFTVMITRYSPSFVVSVVYKAHFCLPSRKIK